MPLTRARGNMYPWVTHTHTHLGGECPHHCEYCYVKCSKKPAVVAKYSGPIRLIEKEFAVNYGSGKTIFLEHCNDLFATAVPDAFTHRVIRHAFAWPNNAYVWQTKNPSGFFPFLFPRESIFGCTIETNRETHRADAPAREDRQRWMERLSSFHRRFVTIEPIMDFDLDELVDWMLRISPTFVNIGADSKGKHLPEPSPGKIRALISTLRSARLDVRLKPNLARLLKPVTSNL